MPDPSMTGSHSKFWHGEHDTSDSAYEVGRAQEFLGRAIVGQSMKNARKGKGYAITKPNRSDLDVLNAAYEGKVLGAKQ